MVSKGEGRNAENGFLKANTSAKFALAGTLSKV
jgi:hypothetical protein